MKIRYLVLRLARHFMPEGLARLFLRRRWLIQPGLESSDPRAAADRYVQALAEAGFDLAGRRVLVFGYGGRLAVGVELLQRGAAQVVLCDHLESLDHERNRTLLPGYSKYLIDVEGRILPRAEFLTLVHGDIRRGEIQNQIGLVDCVLSNSVYEHLDDVGGVTRALAGLTRPDGAQVHFVDLRDHYFRYPFEMLAYSDWVWSRLLNPSSNLNRWRLPAYREVFERQFDEVDIRVLERLEREFGEARPRLRPEFLTGDPAVDSVGLICVTARRPRR